jgi:hypothetical protein
MSRSQLLAGNRAAEAKGLQRVPERNPLSEDGSVSCIACGGRLTFLPYAYPFTFGCDQGHFLTLQALLDVFLPQEQVAGSSALECWDRKSQLMRHLAKRALEVGHVLTAADFQEVAVRIDHWVSTLRGMLPLSESEALLSA